MLNRLTLTAAIVLAAAASGCGPVDARRGSDQITARTVEGIFAAFDRHDAKAMAAFYAADAVMESPDYCAPLRGRAPIERVYRDLFREITDVRDDVRVLIVEGGKASVLFRSRGTQAGTPFEVDIATFFIVQAGKVVRDTTTFDTVEPCRAP